MGLQLRKRGHLFFECLFRKQDFDTGIAPCIFFYKTSAFKGPDDGLEHCKTELLHQLSDAGVWAGIRGNNAQGTC